MPNRVASEIRNVQRSLSALDRALRRLEKSVRGTGSAGAPRERRKLKLSPARKAALKLQGQYMGYLRKLGVQKKAQVKTLRAKKGIVAAIALAKRLR